ncbi:MAG TPA: hypothetical protein VFO83_07995, partial [Aggregicoccus sp.]|nr:hypothetical protein [Aggregicoccus sp.]
AAARAALADRQLEQAVALLEALRDPGGNPLPEARELLDVARRELAVKGNLLAAQRELAEGRTAEAEVLLTRSAGTQSYAGELAVLSAEAQAQRAAAAAAAPARATAAARPTPRAALRAAPLAVAAAAAQAPGSAAQSLYEDGFQLFKKKQFREAEVFFRKCLAAEPGLASCHMMLGTTYANLKQLEQGAHHYRRFLELAPAHPKAAAVRRHLEAYEKARSEAQ